LLSKSRNVALTEIEIFASRSFGEFVDEATHKHATIVFVLLRGIIDRWSALRLSGIPLSTLADALVL
jgi:hypothetical protein